MGAAALQVRSKVFQRRTPKSLAVVERLVAPDPVGHGTYIRSPNDEMRAALTEAYREAPRVR